MRAKAVIPASCRNLDLNKAAKELISRQGNVTAAAKALGVPAHDLRLLTRAQPRLIEAAFERAPWPRVQARRAAIEALTQALDAVAMRAVAEAVAPPAQDAVVDQPQRAHAPAAARGDEKRPGAAVGENAVDDADRAAEQLDRGRVGLDRARGAQARHANSRVIWATGHRPGSIACLPSKIFAHFIPLSHIMPPLDRGSGAP